MDGAIQDAETSAVGGAVPQTGAAMVKQEKIYYHDLIKAAYMYAYIHDRDAYVFVLKGEDFSKPYCHDFRIKVGYIPPDMEGISSMAVWRTPSRWKRWRRVMLDKAIKYMRKKHANRSNDPSVQV